MYSGTNDSTQYHSPSRDITHYFSQLQNLRFICYGGALNSTQRYFQECYEVRHARCVVPNT